MQTGVVRRQLPNWVDPQTVHAMLSKQHPNVVWLDAGPHAHEGFSYLAPVDELLFNDEAVSAVTSTSLTAQSDSVDSGTGPFALGWVGWFGYEFGARMERVPTSPSRYPDVCFARVRGMYAFDHSQHLFFVVGESGELADALVAQVMDLLTIDVPDISSVVQGVRWRHSEPEYERFVQSCQQFIHDGDAFQLCLTNEITVEGTFDAASVYRRLRADNPSHHGALIQIAGVNLLSSSPEVFLRISADGTVATMPIKGTRRRGETSNSDRAMVAQLRDSDKERAENLMIVDLMRNDLSRVCVTGTVVTQNLLEVQTLPHVHQLVSTVSGTMRADTTLMDVLRATFPAGSMTGAPKISAMTILHDLEGGPRGIYSGAFGWVGIDGTSELAMVIRSIVIDESGASIGTGGGITSDSVPSFELDETRLKAAAALRALGVA